MNYYCQCNKNAKLINSLMIINSSLIIKMKYRISLFLKFEFQTIFIIFSSNLNLQKNQINILFTFYNFYNIFFKFKLTKKPNKYFIYTYNRK